MRIACVGAHQDDEMHCLGTLLKYRRRGDEIAFICVSNGDKGASWDPEATAADVAATREREMCRVAEALSAGYSCLGQPDGGIFDGAEIRLAMIQAIRQARPDVIFTHWSQDYIPDHTETCRLTEYAALYAQIASVRTPSPALGHVPAIFHVHPGDGYGFEPTHFVELAPDLLAEKLRILRLHESQMAVMRALRGCDYADIMEKDAARQGARVMRPYAEAFRPCLLERRTPLANLLP